MHKTIYISLLLMSFFSAAQAQKKIIYEDTALLQKDNEYTVPATDEKVQEYLIEPAEDKVAAYEAEITDTSLYLNNLNFPDDSMRQWKNLNEFAYAKYLDSLLKDKNDKQKKKLENRTGFSVPGFLDRLLASSVLKILLWTVTGLFILFILYRLFLAESVFKRAPKTNQHAGAQVEEEIISSQSDFDALINQALQNGNYRQAVRYQYLKTLHNLAGKNFIELAPDKTNFQYVGEIKNREYQNDFAALTLNYEYVWYGEFAIEKDRYQKIEMNFISLNKKL